MESAKDIPKMATEKPSEKNLKKFNLKSLRLSLRYRPKIYKLILKLRQCVRKKSRLVISLQHQLRNAHKNIIYKDSYTQTENDNLNTSIEIEKIEEEPDKEVKENGSTHIDDKTDTSIPEILNKDDDLKKKSGWNVNDNDDKSMSIADQVKEVAQSALQQTGMVYVESAGMYYDYKTGYYYNSELGLYYHTDTECYYYYSDEKQNFVFHSYPDRRAVAANAALTEHQKKKAKKHKKDWKTEDAIDNLTKNLSQDKEDASNQESRPKRRKTSKKKKTEKSHESLSKLESEDSEKLNAEDKKTEDTTNSEETEKEDKKEGNNAAVEESKEELEDGECSNSGSEESDVEDAKSESSTSTASDDDTVAKHHAPCMRVIVKETSLPKLKVGSLFLVTKDGGTIGREGDQHAILIRDHNVSRNHLDIRYDLALRNYVVMDLGSKNGTILNGTRMSESQVVSKPLEVLHGSIIQLGETKLLCHIHPGKDTCGHCEPGLLMETQEKEKKVAYTRTCSVQKQHQLELARLKNKYAPQPLAIEQTAYSDRAQQRRAAVGSSHHAEKTQATDVDTFIAPENKGFKLLEKMGWSKGEGLGKDNQGDTEPIPLVSNEGKAGLGATDVPRAAPSGTLGPATMRLLNKTKILKPPAKAFQNVEDDDLESD